MSDENLMGVVTPEQPDAQDNAANEAPDTANEAQDDKPEKTFTQAELDKIVQREKARAERRAERSMGPLLEKISSLEQSINELRTKPKAEAADAAQAAPKREDFDTYEDYVEAKAEFRALQVLKKEQETQRKQAEETERKTRQERAVKEFEKATAARIEAGRKAYADFDAVINEAFEDGVIPAGSALHYALVEDTNWPTTSPNIQTTQNALLLFLNGRCCANSGSCRSSSVRRNLRTNLRRWTLLGTGAPQVLRCAMTSLWTSGRADAKHN